MTHTEHKLQLAALWMLLTSEEHSENVRAEVHAGHGVRVRPAQTFGQREAEARVGKVDDLLHFLIRRDGVRRPVEGGDNLPSLDADEIVPKFDAVAIVVLGDDEGAEGSVDVECGFVFVHVYKVAQITRKARDFFAIMKLFFGELARFLNCYLCKSLNIKELRPAARRPAVSG